MVWRKKKRAAQDATPPTVPVSLADVKKLVRDFEEQLPKDMNRTVLLGEDNEINFRLLQPFLHGLPDRKFYMSRETFEIFPEEERDIPKYLDMVQQAVDGFIAEEGTAPVVSGDPNRRINYTLLLQYYLLKERPPMDFYLSRHEDMITHLPPEA